MSDSDSYRSQILYIYNDCYAGCTMYYVNLPPLSVKLVKKVGGPKAAPPKRVRNRDVIHVTGITLMVLKSIALHLTTQ